ncbi:MAG: hypothetical protein OXE94_15135 [Aestuariivita sp.]|nr:hypothetical protein [Aestuariivita sp.]MCY4202707.1 hypothetical protein [Aestuariivita sp.]MCY4347750.1 hypothetical protein [Aestuariivita sp.]
MLPLLTLGLGCANEEDRTRFDGHYFRTNAAAVDRSDRRQFEVTVRNATASLVGAKEAGEYEAIRYCIEAYGTSDIKWLGGDDLETIEKEVVNDRLTLVGTCQV